MQISLYSQCRKTEGLPRSATKLVGVALPFDGDVFYFTA